MKHVLPALAFYAKYPGWQSYNHRDRATVRAVNSLTKRGFLELSKETKQARFTGKTGV
jgi:hypothetical protein